MPDNKGTDWGGVIGTGLGLIAPLLQNKKAQDKRQLKQQQGLTDIQAKANKSQAEYERQLAMQMWKDTNFDAQKAEMEKAGLSIAGMYSGAGGGGTAGGVSVAGVGGGSASDSASMANAETNKIGMALQGAQLGLLGAQKENIEADTRNKEAGAGGQEIENEVKGNTKNSQELQIGAEAQRSAEEASMATTRNQILKATSDMEIARQKAVSKGEEIHNLLMNADIKVSKQRVINMVREIQESVQRIAIEKGKLSNEVIKNAWQETVARDGLGIERGNLDQRQNEMLMGLVYEAIGMGRGGIGTSTNTKGYSEKKGSYMEKRTTKSN